ncbi:uncharacterized protein LOC135439040 [Drosophila montana]|uniref:uncharacterized protein LOC135439040 n=1 Tax=Drosophila montana TaxID=40370 RepID=UPI00313C8731
MHRLREKLQRSSENATESSLAWPFCERCCGERRQQRQEQQQPGIVAFYRSCMDSVSDLSSYRFVSDEEEANDNVVDANDDVSVGSLSLPCVEIEQKKSKTSTIAQYTKTSATNKASKVEVPHASAFSLPDDIRSVLPIIRGCNNNKVILRQTQEQHLLKVSTSFRKNHAPIGHSPNDSCRCSRDYNFRPYLRCGRRNPQPVQPKPKSRPRICFGVTACGSNHIVEPALKIPRLERCQKHRHVHPLSCVPLKKPLVLTNTHFLRRGPRSCSDLKYIYSYGNGCTQVTAENSSDSTSRKKLQWKSTCILRYDRNEHLKKDFNQKRNSEQKQRLKTAGETGNLSTSYLAATINRDETSEYFNIARRFKNEESKYIDSYKRLKSNGFDLSKSYRTKAKLKISDDSAVHIDLNSPDEPITNRSEKSLFFHNFDKSCSQSNISSNISLH